jgi:hypothetical protein
MKEPNMHRARPFAHPGYDPKLGREPPAEPFRDAEEAWFWTMAALRARREGSGFAAGRGRPRPCTPDDVVRCLEGLYQRKRIDLGHARVLRFWGERGISPDRHHAADRRDAELWTEAMTLLEWRLRVRAIVVPVRILSGDKPRLEIIGKKAIDAVMQAGI